MAHVSSREQVKEQLASLIGAGDRIHMQEYVNHASKDELNSIEKALSMIKSDVLKDQKQSRSLDKLSERMGTKPDPLFNFSSEYQMWYSNALRVVEQLMPDRYQEFRELYRPERRKDIDVSTYSIADYIAGIVISRLGSPDFNTRNVALGRFKQQIHIVGSTQARLDSALQDIYGVLEAELADGETDSARTLLASGHLRSAGMIAGVVLERHLKRVLSNHQLTIGRKKSTLSNLNEALKAGGVYDLPMFRRIQHLTDIRNLCAHDSEREPIKDEAIDLVDQVAKLSKTLF